MPAISVIIPIYNVEKYLRRCLDSVKNQTFQDWEAICVNDGSPDNSAAILAEFAAGDARFKVVNKENGGLSDARNAGMQVATGEYILYLDSDDFIHPQTLEIAHRMALTLILSHLGLNVAIIQKSRHKSMPRFITNSALIPRFSVGYSTCMT